MKYIVEVNAKWLVSIEAESLSNAEHKLLDYSGVWGALAFDRAMMKTDTFAGAVQGCEMVSMDELAAMVSAVCAAKTMAVKADLDREDAEAKYKELEAELAAAKQRLLDAQQAASDTKATYNRAVEKLGRERR